MKKYIDAEKLVAEIDGMLSACTKQTHTGVYNTCHRIKGIIASLQQEQPEVDLVTELKHHLATTPKEQLEKEWKKLEPWGNIGPTVQEFLYGKQPQPAEWSEEDEKCIKDIINCLKYLEMEDTERQYNGDRNVNPKRYSDMIAKLKSLRPQPSWKPSDNQMGTLKDTEGTHNGHDYVDLGIRNDKGERILFATCNIGASCPEEYGDYFACGETSIRKRQDTPFTLDNAPFYNNKTHKFDKYNLEDKLGTLKETDDVATVTWGEGWRMPEREEFKLLLKQTDHKWVTNYKDTGVNGYLFAGKDEFSSSVLFLPAAGSCYVDSGRYRPGDYGDYWSRSIHPDEPDFAYNLYFDFEDGNYCVVSLDNRYSGLSVRPVLVLPE